MAPRKSKHAQTQNARISGIRVDAARVIKAIAITFIQIPERTICGIVKGDWRAYSGMISKFNSILSTTPGWHGVPAKE